jgi:hypothetical protein
MSALPQGDFEVEYNTFIGFDKSFGKEFSQRRPEEDIYCPCRI